MEKSLYLPRLLIAVLCCLPLMAQNPIIGPSVLEANMGPIAIDFYDQVSTVGAPGGGGLLVLSSGLLPSPDRCTPTSIYRECIRSILTAFAAQGVAGVRVQFGLHGGWFSTPFANKAGALKSHWMPNLQLLF